MDQPLVRAVALFCFGIVLGRHLPFLAEWTGGILIAAVSTALLALLSRRARSGRVFRIIRFGAAACAVLAAGAYRYALTLRLPPEDVSRRVGAAPVRLTGVVADFPRVERHGVSFTLDCRRIAVGGKDEKATGRAQVNLHAPFRELEKVIARGNLLAVFSRLSLPEERGNPGEASPRERLAAEGVRVKADLYDTGGIVLLREAGPLSPAGWLGKIRRRMETAIHESLPSPGGAPGSLASILLEGLVLGVKGRIPYQIRENFREIGVIHVLVVSGLHVGFIFYLGGLLFSSFTLRWRYGLTVPLIFFYVRRLQLDYLRIIPRCWGGILKYPPLYRGCAPFSSHPTPP